MKKRNASLTQLVGAVAPAFGARPALSQTNADLKKEIDSLKQGQKAIQKDIKVIRDILSGKQPPLENVSVNTDGAPFQGERYAKVVMVEFSDFQCPFCGRYNTQTYSQVIDEYVKTGKVKSVFRDFRL